MQALAGMQRLRGELENAQREMSRSVFKGSSTEPTVVATVDGIDGLVDLQISPEAITDPDLAKGIVSAVRAATAAANAHYANMLGPVSRDVAQLQKMFA